MVRSQLPIVYMLRDKVANWHGHAICTLMGEKWQGDKVSFTHIVCREIWRCYEISLSQRCSGGRPSHLDRTEPLVMRQSTAESD